MRSSMSMIGGLLPVMLISVCCGAGVAVAETGLGYSATSTALSGNRGAEVILERESPADFAVYGFEASERSDDPCYLKVLYKDVQNGDTTVDLFAECGDNNQGRGTRKSREPRMLPDGVWAVGARVCLNRARTKIKGLSLMGAYEACIKGAETVLVSVNDCSPVLDIDSHDYRLCSDPDGDGYAELRCDAPSTGFVRWFERPNCPGIARGPDDDWEREVRCPANHVASGLLLSTADGGGDRQMIDGVGVQCRELQEFNSRKIITRKN